MAFYDFCPYELLPPHGIERRHILFFEDITTREAWCGGITGEPDDNYMARVARNQVDCFEDKLRNMKYLIHDNALRSSKADSQRFFNHPDARQS